MCRRLPDLSNLVWPEGLLYTRNTNIILEHDSPDGSNDYELDEGYNLRWPPI